MTTINVGLLWHSLDSGNLGVVALTVSQMRLVREAANAAGVQVRFVVIGGTREGADAGSSGADAVCRVTRNRLLGFDSKLRETFAGCDLILDIGEGDSFADIYGLKRLVFHIGTKLWAQRGSRRFVFAPQTLGPFKGNITGWWANRVMAGADLVCTRDQLSTAFYQGRGLKTPLLEVTDVAFALPFEQAQKFGGRPRVGINVSGLLWSGGYTGNNQFGLKLDYRRSILDLVDWFTVVAGADVWLVPHVVTPDREVEDDWRASQQVSALRPHVQLAGPFESPSAAKSFISGLDYFTGARMHACIAAFSSGVPGVPMAYSRKFTGLFGTLGYSHVADCQVESESQVIQRIKTGFEHRDELAQQVRVGMQAAEGRLDRYRAALASLLTECAGAH
ncbi:polysaccharide pyruvyl transferase family protein [Pseudaquabacterium pictum]|uniref:Polysaccharide pyruvyl transferase domain-containing protein n=1 Tax=Pseudaquabacterium pictum TaxID=2315236 RepID=A0A480AU96_9BURK|nr:polysaccharide pyruvyl transferase family protein [Rubrivivax pictus]GCL65114.1 hypothetical protein AQPW35_41950 [Rubrivivax pictus]